MKTLCTLILALSLFNFSFAQSKDDIIETIIVSGVAEVYFTHENTQEKTRRIVTGKPSPEVIVNFKDGILEVITKGEAHNEVVEIYVSSRHLKNIIVKDAAQFHSTNTINVESLEITVDGHSSADLKVNTKNLKINMSGGDLVVSGKSTNCEARKYEGHEYGTLDFKNFDGKNTYVE